MPMTPPSASACGPSAAESYSGTAANYRYQVKSTSGSGAYTLCVTKP